MSLVMLKKNRPQVRRMKEQFRGGHFLVKDLVEDERPFGWDEVFYAHGLGYWLAGPFGEMKKLSKQEGRLYMRGLAAPVR